MTAETENMVLEMLRRIRASQERTELDVMDMKARMSTLEQHEGQVLTLQGQVVTLLGTLNQRLDRFDERLGRIERRLDVVEA
jgi:tRNA(Phe) wybutosine-synthesizing methylase Tyw3